VVGNFLLNVCSHLGAVWKGSSQWCLRGAKPHSRVWLRARIVVQYSTVQHTVHQLPHRRITTKCGRCHLLCGCLRCCGGSGSGGALVGVAEGHGDIPGKGDHRGGLLACLVLVASGGDMPTKTRQQIATQEQTGDRQDRTAQYCTAAQPSRLRCLCQGRILCPMTGVASATGGEHNRAGPSPDLPTSCDCQTAGIGECHCRVHPFGAFHSRQDSEHFSTTHRSIAVHAGNHLRTGVLCDDLPCSGKQAMT
jgi:hypothetical protein